MTCFEISTIIIGFVSILTAIIIAICNQRQAISLMRKNIFNSAKNRFIDQLVPFYHEVCDMVEATTGAVDDSVNWSLNRTRQLRFEHRRAINEIRFSIPPKDIISFDKAANTYCPHEENNDYYSDGDREKEMKIRKLIKTRLESLMNFKI